MNLHERVQALGLQGLLADWEHWADAPWLPAFLDAEEKARNDRSLKRRISAAKLGRFKDLADFDWDWPEQIDRAHIEELAELGFVGAKRNVALVGPNGVGKTMIVKNLAYRAALAGHTVLCTTASNMLNELGSRDSARTLTASIRKYCRPTVLVIDEIGYLSYSNRAADLLFEVVTGRYESKPIVLTTNRSFGAWDEVFPNATSVVTLVDRLLHHSEVVSIKGKSWRRKEFREAAEQASKRRAKG
jgi:DNA replication protein DnaC